MARRDDAGMGSVRDWVSEVGELEQALNAYNLAAGSVYKCPPVVRGA